MADDIVERLRCELAANMVKVVSSSDLFSLIGPMQGLSRGTVELRVSQLVREAWNKLPPACGSVTALLSEHARQREEIGRLLKLHAAVHKELWVDECLRRGRTDFDPVDFNSRPVIRLIDEAIDQRTALSDTREKE